MLAKIPDLMDIYPAYVAPYEKLNVACYRNKYY